jgi:hypothetical protein
MSGFDLRLAGVSKMSNPLSNVYGAQVDPNLKFKYDSSDPAVGANPVPYYQSLLAPAPIVVERRGIPWGFVSRYRDCVEVLRDHRRFSSLNPNLPGTEDFDAFRRRAGDDFCRSAGPYAAAAGCGAFPGGAQNI